MKKSGFHCIGCHVIFQTKESLREHLDGNSICRAQVMITIFERAITDFIPVEIFVFLCNDVFGSDKQADKNLK